MRAGRDLLDPIAQRLREQMRLAGIEALRVVEANADRELAGD